MHNLFTHLKSDTFQQHRKLEHSAPFSVFHSNAPIPFASYRAILSTMYCFHQQVSHLADECINQMRAEDSLGVEDMKALTALLNIEGVVSALQKDITSLGSANSEHYGEHSVATSALNTPSPTDLSVALPRFNSVTSSCIAGFYVWMGSSMGANVISRRLHEQKNRCDTPLSLPTHYYNTMALSAQDWVNFKQQTLRALNVFADDNQALSVAIVQDANHWFSYLMRLGSKTM